MPGTFGVKLIKIKKGKQENGITREWRKQSGERKVESQVNESEYCSTASFGNFAASQRRKRGERGRGSQDS